MEYIKDYINSRFDDTKEVVFNFKNYSAIEKRDYIAYKLGNLACDIATVGFVVIVSFLISRSWFV